MRRAEKTRTTKAAHKLERRPVPYGRHRLLKPDLLTDPEKENLGCLHEHLAWTRRRPAAQPNDIWPLCKDCATQRPGRKGASVGPGRKDSVLRVSFSLAVPNRADERKQTGACSNPAESRSLQVMHTRHGSMSQLGTVRERTRGFRL